jgi:hypothetical protein
MLRCASLALLLAACGLGACHGAAGTPDGEPARSTSLPAASGASSGESSAGGVVAPSASPSSEPARSAPEPDGDDDPTDSGHGSLPEPAHFERVGRAPLALRRICDLTPFGHALYAAHAYEPLDMDGATITRYDPADERTPFSVAFDWNRAGEPARNGGAGQGFLRVHAIGGRLFVPDADPPYNGFELTEPGTEGYVFVSDGNGVFAPPKMPHHKPPDGPDGHGGPGAGILPRAYHVLDVIRFRGRLYASTGSVPPGERAWHGPSPGALHVANGDLSRWTYEVDYPPYPWKDGVWRLGYLVRYRGRLYAGIQDYDGSEPNDYLVFDPPAGAARITAADVHAVRVTAQGTARTLRWYSHDGKLYWIAWARDGVKLRVTDDGELWRVVELPRHAGWPADITLFRGVLVVLAAQGLYRLDQDPPTLVARVTTRDGHSPFEVADSFCAAPLAVLDDELYAGGQRDGALYRLREGP